MRSRYIQQTAVTLAAAFVLGQSSLAQVVFSEDFEAEVNPVNSETFPGFGTWYLPSTPDSDNEFQDTSVIATAAETSANAPGGFGGSVAMRMGWRFDAIELRIGLNDTWDPNFDYSLTFRTGAQNLGAFRTGGLRVNARADAGGVITAANSVTLAYTHSDIAGYVDNEVVISGADIAAAGASGQNIYLEFFCQTNIDIIWLDDIELSRTPAVAPPDTGNFLVLISEFGSDLVGVWEVINGTWNKVSNFVLGPVELVVGAGDFENPSGVAVDPATGRVYIAQTGPGSSFIYEFESDGTLTTRGPLEDGILADSAFEFSGTADALTIGPDGNLYFGTTDGDPLTGNNEVYQINLNQASTPTSLFVSNSDPNYTLLDLRGITFGGDGNLYVCNRGPFNDVLTAGEDQVLRFQGPAGGSPGEFIDVFYDLENRPSGIRWDADNNRLLVAFDDAQIAFTDLNDSSVNTLLAATGFVNNPSDIASLGGQVFMLDEGNTNQMVRVGPGVNAVYPVTSGLGDPDFFAIVGTFEVSTWDGGGANDNWSTALNWESDVTPVFNDPDNLARLFFTGSTRPTPNNDVANAFVNSLVFDSGADAFDIGGNGFTLTSILNNDSPMVQTLSTGTIVSDNATFSTINATGDASDDLLITSGIDTGSTDDVTTFAGAGSTSVSGIVSGSGGITKNGSGALRLSAANTYSGPTVLNTGQIVATNATSLGNTSEGTIIGTGNDVRLELDSGITVAEPIVLDERSGTEYLQRQIESISGVNTLSGTVTLARNGVNQYNFAAMTGAQLVFDGTLDASLEGLYVLRTVGDPNVAEGIVEYATSIPGSSSIETRVAVNVGTTILSAISNGLNGRLGAFRTGEIQLINASTANNVANCANIQAFGIDSVIDFSGLSGGGIVLSNDNVLIDGQGTFRGSVTTDGSANVIAPTGTAGTLTFEDGLNLTNGATLDVNIGEEGDLIRVSGGTFNGSASSGAITIAVTPNVPFSSGTYTVIDFAGAAAAGLSASDFVVDTSAVPGLISSAIVSVTATTVDLIVTASGGGLTDVLVVSGPAATSRVDRYAVQAGVWSFQGTFIDGIVDGNPVDPFGIAQDPVSGDIIICERDPGNGPHRVLRYDRSGFLLEVIGTDGIDYNGRPEFLDIDAATGDIFFVKNQVPRDIVKYEASSGTFIDPFIPEDDPNLTYSTGRIRALAVAPGGRLFAGDSLNNQILEFDTTSGALNQLLDTPTAPLGMVWDSVSNRLIVAVNAGGGDTDDVLSYPGGNLPSVSLLDQSVDPFSIHDIARIEDDLYVASFTFANINRIDSASTVVEVANNTPGPIGMIVADVLTAGRYDLDMDDDIDGDDAVIFFACVSGPGNTTVPAGCTPIQFAKCDANDDGDVDMDDVDAFMLESSLFLLIAAQ